MFFFGGWWCVVVGVVGGRWLVSLRSQKLHLTNGASEINNAYKIFVCSIRSQKHYKNIKTYYKNIPNSSLHTPYIAPIYSQHSLYTL